jgi:hypothetical protein
VRKDKSSIALTLPFWILDFRFWIIKPLPANRQAEIEMLQQQN